LQRPTAVLTVCDVPIYDGDGRIANRLPMTTLIKYQNDPHHRACEVALDSGERVLLMVDRTGVVIERAPAPGIPGVVLFRGKPEVAAEICASLTTAHSASGKTPMDIILAAMVGLGSAAKIRTAFRRAALLISDARQLREKGAKHRR
jgi:hypothetical protein